MGVYMRLIIYDGCVAATCLFALAQSILDKRFSNDSFAQTELSCDYLCWT